MQLAPLLASQQHVRRLYVTLEVFGQLDHDTVDEGMAVGLAGLRVRLDSFMMGRVLVVGGRRSSAADFKRLDPGRDEVWEIRKREAPSVRIFGRFAKQDVFVATGIRLRVDLLGFRSLFWRQEMRRCKQLMDVVISFLPSA